MYRTYFLSVSGIIVELIEVKEAELETLYRLPTEVQQGEGVRMVNVQLRYYMHISDPDSLSDEEWAMRFR